MFSNADYVKLLLKPEKYLFDYVSHTLDWEYGEKIHL